MILSTRKDKIASIELHCNDNLFVLSNADPQQARHACKTSLNCPVNVQASADNQADIVQTVIIASAGNCVFLAEILISIVDQ